MLPLGLISFFGWASAPEPLALFCAPLAFATVGVVYGLLGLRWPEVLVMAGLCFVLGCAALAATLLGMATHSYGWGFLTFAVGVVVAGFANWKFWEWRERRRTTPTAPSKSSIRRTGRPGSRRPGSGR